MSEVELFLNKHQAQLDMWVLKEKFKLEKLNEMNKKNKQLYIIRKQQELEKIISLKK